VLVADGHCCLGGTEPGPCTLLGSRQGVMERRTPNHHHQWQWQWQPPVTAAARK